MKSAKHFYVLDQENPNSVLGGSSQEPIDEAHKQQCRNREHQAWLKFFAGKAQLARCDLSCVSTKASCSITASLLTSFRGSGFAVSLIEVGLPYWTIN